MSNKKTPTLEDLQMNMLMKLEKAYGQLIEMMVDGQTFDEEDMAEFKKLQKHLGYSEADFKKHYKKVQKSRKGKEGHTIRV